MLRPFGVKEMCRTGIIAMAADTRPASCKKIKAKNKNGGRNVKMKKTGAKMYYDKDADLGLLKGKKIAIIGYGSQGHAQALNLKDSGLNVAVAELNGSDNYNKAVEAGWKPVTAAEAVKDADWIQILVADEVQSKVWQAEIKPNIKKGATLAFSHGFNIRFGQIVPPKDVNVVMIAPKGPGHLVRRQYEEGKGVPCLIAVEQDATGNAHQIGLAYAKGIGGTRGGVIETTFSEETETDLFGEQVVLCGARRTYPCWF